MGGLPLETWVQIGALAGAAALVVGLLALARGGRAAAEGRIERRLLAEQLREQERVLARSLNDTRHTVAAQLTALRQSEQRAILTGVGRLHQAIERRLGDLQTRLAADAGELRTSSPPSSARSAGASTRGWPTDSRRRPKPSVGCSATSPASTRHRSASPSCRATS